MPNADSLSWWSSSMMVRRVVLRVVGVAAHPLASCTPSAPQSSEIEWCGQAIDRLAALPSRHGVVSAPSEVTLRRPARTTETSRRQPRALTYASSTSIVWRFVTETLHGFADGASVSARLQELDGQRARDLLRRWDVTSAARTAPPCHSPVPLWLSWLAACAQASLAKPSWVPDSSPPWRGRNLWPTPRTARGSSHGG